MATCHSPLNWFAWIRESNQRHQEAITALANGTALVVPYTADQIILMPTDQDRIDCSETLREALADVQESIHAIKDRGVVRDEITFSVGEQELTDAFAKLQAGIK